MRQVLRNVLAAPATHGATMRSVLGLGATGASGRCVIAEGLARGHRVVALARSESARTSLARGAQVTTGDALRSGDLIDVVRDVDAVVSCLGSRPWRHVDVCSMGMDALLRAYETTGTRRTVVMSSFGVRATRGETAWLERVMFYDLVIRRSLDDKARMEELLQASSVPFTIVRPGLLTSGDVRSSLRAADDGSIRGSFLHVSRQSVARFMLDAIESEQWLRRAPTLAY